MPFVGFATDGAMGGLVRAAFDWYNESAIFGGGIALPVGGRFLNGLCSVLVFVVVIWRVEKIQYEIRAVLKMAKRLTYRVIAG